MSVASPTTPPFGDVTDRQIAGFYIAFCCFCGFALLIVKWLNDKCGCWQRTISGFAPFTIPCNIEDVHSSNDEIIIKHWNNYSLKQDNKNETLVRAHGVQWKSCRFTVECDADSMSKIKLRHSSGKYLSLTSYLISLQDSGRLVPQYNDNNTYSAQWKNRSLAAAAQSKFDSRMSNEIEIFAHQISNGKYRFESVKNAGYYMAVLPPTESMHARDYFIGAPRMVHINDLSFSKYTLFYLFKKSEQNQNQNKCKSKFESIQCFAVIKCLLSLTPLFDIFTDIWTVAVYILAGNEVAAVICIMMLYYSFRIYWFFHFSITKIGIKMKDVNFGIVKIMSCSLLPFFSLFSLEPFFCWRRRVGFCQRIFMFLKEPFLWKGKIRSEWGFCFFLILELLLNPIIIFQTIFLILRNCLSDFKIKWRLIGRKRSDLKKKEEQRLITNEFLKGCECLFEAIPQLIFQTYVFFMLYTNSKDNIDTYRVLQYVTSAVLSTIALIRTIYAIKTEDLWSKSLLDIIDMAQVGSLIDYKYIRKVEGVDDDIAADGGGHGADNDANILLPNNDNDADEGDNVFGAEDAGDFDAGDFGS